MSKKRGGYWDWGEFTSAIEYHARKISGRKFVLTHNAEPVLDILFGKVANILQKRNIPIAYMTWVESYENYPDELDAIVAKKLRKNKGSFLFVTDNWITEAEMGDAMGLAINGRITDEDMPFIRETLLDAFKDFLPKSRIAHIQKRYKNGVPKNDYFYFYVPLPKRK